MPHSAAQHTTPSPKLDAAPTATLVIANSEGLLSTRFRYATISLVVLVALIAFEALAVATAMPQAAQALNGLRLYALAFGGTLATGIIGMTFAGAWCDTRSPGHVMFGGLITFIVGLLLAGFATTMIALLTGRLLQGLGMGSISVTVYVIAARLYPEALRPRLFAALSGGWLIPALIGPTLSGVITQLSGWRWVFLLVALLALPTLLVLIPVLRAVSTRATQPLQWRTLSWSIGAALGIGLLYWCGQQSITVPVTTCLLIAALLLTGICTQRLLPIGTLRFAVGLPSVIALRGAACAAFFGCEAFVPLLLSRQRGLSASGAGVALSIAALGWFASSWYQGHRYAGSRQRLIRIGGISLLLGIGLFMLALWPNVPVTIAIFGWGLAGLGMGLVYPSLTLLALAQSTPETQGRHSSALQLCESVSIATTLAIGGSMFAALLTYSESIAYLAALSVTLVFASLSIAITTRTTAS